MKKRSKVLAELSGGGGNFLQKLILKAFVYVYETMFFAKRVKFNRAVSFGDYFVDRSEKAARLGFGAGSSVYDNVLVLGDVKVGANTWIGPNVVLDGSGGLEIGSNCSISAGVQIYSHDSVKWALSGGAMGYEYAKTTIGDRCYIAPGVIIQKGVSVGSGSVIGANSFVNKDIPSGVKAYGTPARVVGKV
ncbi:MAG: acyltransferase [Helicobacteraceae bacterium]